MYTVLLLLRKIYLKSALKLVQLALKLYKLLRSLQNMPDIFMPRKNTYLQHILVIRSIVYNLFMSKVHTVIPLLSFGKILYNFNNAYGILLIYKIYLVIA